MWNSFWVEQLFGSSVRQLAVEGGRGRRVAGGVTWVRAEPRYFNIWFKQREFPKRIFCVLPRCQQQQQQQQQRGCNNDSCIFCISLPPSSPLSLSLELAHNANNNSAVRALSASTFNFQRQSAGVGGRGQGEEGEGGSVLKILDMQLPVQLCNWQATDLDEALRCHRHRSRDQAEQERERERGRQHKWVGAGGSEAARLTLILIPATDLPACLPPTVAAKSDRATCVRCSWQFCFALQSLKWVGKRNRNRNRRRNSKRKSNRNIRNAEGSQWGDLWVPISQANSLTYNLFLKQLMRRVKKGLRVAIPIKREFSVLRYSD